MVAVQPDLGVNNSAGDRYDWTCVYSTQINPLHYYRRPRNHNRWAGEYPPRPSAISRAMQRGNIGGGTGGALGHRDPVECEILTLTLWALHGASAWQQARRRIGSKQNLAKLRRSFSGQVNSKVAGDHQMSDVLVPIKGILQTLHCLGS